jgi:alanine racemase
VHVKVDTGMGRAGVWHEQAAELFAFVLADPGLEWRGVYTHFSDADHDQAFTAAQRATFLLLLETIPAAVRAGLRHRCRQQRRPRVLRRRAPSTRCG